MTLDGPDADEPGIIDEMDEDGFPIVFKLVDELPPPDVRDALPTLAK